VVVGVWAKVLLLDGLERLVHSLMLTCMGWFVGGVGFSNLSRLPTLAKLVVMSGCLEYMRSCSGLGLLGRLLNEYASKNCHRLAMRVHRGSGLEIVSVSERWCSGEFACRSLRR